MSTREPTAQATRARPGSRSAPFGNDRAPWVVITQVFFGLGWLRAVAEKVISIDWWTGEVIRAFVADHAQVALPWIEPILDPVVGAAPLAALVVLGLQAFVGLALVSNRFVPRALVLAMALNLIFVAIGAVNPSVFYLLGQGAVALWLIGRRPPTRRLSRDLRLAAGVAVALAVISAPFVATLHPALAIDDPAIMVVTLGGLTAMACELTHRAVFGRSLR